MTLLNPLMLFGWVPFTIFLFFNLKPHHAVLVCVIGGTLFLSMAGYDLLGLPDYNKNTAIALGLILGGRVSGKRQAVNFQVQIYDVPMLLWCLCPLATSISNHLGIYDGLSGVWTNTMIWGIPYLSGRLYFTDQEKLRSLCMGLVIGGLIYLPLCLYEIRMSPQLSVNLYGFFPHSFIQHARFGGFRPIVFMQHGLMVSLWMALTTTILFWLWRSGEIKHLKGFPVMLLFPAMVITTVLCKSVNGWVALAIGCFGYFCYRLSKSTLPFRLLLLAFPCYIFLRITGFLDANEIESLASHFFDAERILSLGIRLRQEDLFIVKAVQRFLLGWGGFDRAWPINPETGRKAIEMIDSLWLIAFSTNGLIGLVSLSSGMLLGPWMVLRSLSKQILTVEFSFIGPLVLSLVVVLFMIDSLMNGMVNPVYILISGALVCWRPATPLPNSTVNVWKRD